MSYRPAYNNLRAKKDRYRRRVNNRKHSFRRRDKKVAYQYTYCYFGWDEHKNLAEARKCSACIRYSRFKSGEPSLEDSKELLEQGFIPHLSVSCFSMDEYPCDCWECQNRNAF